MNLFSFLRPKVAYTKIGEMTIADVVKYGKRFIGPTGDTVGPVDAVKAYLELNLKSYWNCPDSKVTITNPDSFFVTCPAIDEMVRVATQDMKLRGQSGSTSGLWCWCDSQDIEHLLKWQWTVLLTDTWVVTVDKVVRDIGESMNQWHDTLRKSLNELELHTDFIPMVEMVKCAVKKEPEFEIDTYTITPEHLEEFFTLSEKYLIGNQAKEYRDYVIKTFATRSCNTGLDYDKPKAEIRPPLQWLQRYDEEYAKPERRRKACQGILDEIIAAREKMSPTAVQQSIGQ